MSLNIGSQLNLDFDIVNQSDCRFLTLLDTSTYLTQPNTPFYDITVPGYSTPIRINANPSSTTVVNSSLLQLTSITDIAELPNLPDGVYTISYLIFPTDTNYVTKKLLRTCEVECKFLTAFAKWDVQCDGCKNNKDLLNEIFIYIESAKANASLCNYNKAAELLQKANLKLGNIDCNCR